MKNFLLLGAALMAIANLFAKTPETQITPEVLPSGVSMVSPAQGFVDTSGSASPLGVSDIGVTFTTAIDVNTACTEPALLYFNDFNTPADKTTSKSVDMMTYRTGGVQFKQITWNQTGLYKVVIPEGYWKYDSGAPTPQITLYYEIYIGYNVLPAPGVVPELSNVYITFPEADEVRFNTSGRTCQFYMDNSDNEYTLGHTIIDYSGNGKKNTVAFSFGASGGIAAEFNNPGTYGLLIDAGYIEFITYGPNYANDPEDYILRSNNQLLLKYQIPAIPIPEIYPYTDEPIEYFDEFTLYMPDNFTKWFTNDRTASNIYKVSESGIVDTSRSLCRVRFVLDNNIDPNDKEEMPYADRIILNLFDVETGEPLEKFEPASGLYCLRLADGLFTGMYQSLIAGSAPEMINSNPFDYYYEVSNGISEVEESEIVVAEELGAVYNLSGIRVAAKGDAETINALAPGFYIINGKKIVKY